MTILFLAVCRAGIEIGYHDGLVILLLYFWAVSLVLFVIYALIASIISKGKLVLTLLLTLSLMTTGYFIWGYLFAVIMKIEPKVLTILMSVFVGGPYIHYFSYELRCLRKENLKG